MKRIRILLLALAVTVAGVGISTLSYTPQMATAQNLIVNPLETTAFGLKIPVYNATDSLITDGCLVYADTTTTTAYINSKRPVVRPANAIARTRVIGIAVGNIQRSSKGGSGTVLVWGYHPNAWMAVSNPTINMPIKISESVYGRFALADTQGVACGYMISLSSATPLATANGAAAVVYRAKVWFFGSRSNGQSAL